MKDLTLLKSYNVLSKSQISEPVHSDGGLCIKVSSEEFSPINIFIPSCHESHLNECLLSFYVQHKLWCLHNEVKESDLSILLKNYAKYEDLVTFDFNNKTYKYSSLIELNKVSEEHSNKVKNWLIELNLDLSKLNYHLK